MKSVASEVWGWGIFTPPQLYCLKILRHILENLYYKDPPVWRRIFVTFTS